MVDAAELRGVSYRQGKRWWKRYGEKGAEGLPHRSGGRGSNRAKPLAFRAKLLRLVRKKYGGEEGSGLGRRCGGGCWRKGWGAGRGGAASLS